MKKIFSFLAALLFASSMMAANYVKTAYADIQTDDVVIITMQNANGVYAASNDQGTSNAPVATAVTVADDAITTDATNILWTVTKDGANITFNAGDKALYCITSNNGVRVGSNANNVFSIDATSGYLFNNATSRYVGVYNSQDFRCYTSVNSNIQKQTLAFFVLSEGGEEPVAVKTKTIYCKVAQDWWKTDGAAVGAYAWKGEEKNAAWPGARMTAVEGETDMWKIDLDLTKYESVIFTRVNGTGDIVDWGAKTADLTIPADKDLYTITSTAAVWGDPGVVGEWSKYEASTGGDDPVVEPATADFTKAFTLKFNGTGTTNDNSATFTVADGVAKVFDATSALYVKELTTVENVFSGRIIAEEASSLKFGTSSKKGTLAFALGQEIEVDSIIVNATQYGNNAAEVTVNGTKFDLTAGNKVPTDCKITPEGKVSAITIAQTGSERIYLRYVTVYPKKQGGETPVVEEPAVIKMHGNFTGDWANTDAFTLSEDKKTATLKLALNKGNYEFGMRIGADNNWTSNGVAFTRENKSAAVAAGTGNLTLAADTKGDYTFTWTYATNTLAIDFPEYVETLPEMQIAGAWNVENEAWVKNAMTPAEDKKTASYEVELKAGDYEFKVIKDSKWLTKANEGNAYGLHREWTGVANVKDEATENLKLTADVDGKYTFVWTFANDSLGVVFPEKPAEPAAAVVLPATLDVTNVSFRSEGMPDFVVEEGQDYAGTYFDMGAHDSSNDTLLYAEWNVTIQPIKYNVAVDVYNTNGWTVQLYLLNQAGDTVKALRYKGSSGKSGQFAIGALDLSDLEAGDYKVRARAATAWSAMKLKDVIFTADYKGVSVELPGTLQPAYAELSSGASVANDAIAFKPSTANNEYATWNVSFAKAGKYNVTIDMTATNGHTYGVALLSADGAEQIGAVAEAQAWDTGVKELGAITVPAAGKYVVKLTNATQWSEAVLNSITFAAAAAEPAKFYITGDSALVVNAGLDKAKAWNPDAIKSTETSYKLNLAAGDYKLKVVVGEGEAAQWLGFDALTTTADGLTADGDGNICFTLTEAGEVNVHYDGEFFFLYGNFYVGPVEVKYYLKNNWDGGEWTWKEMTDLGDGTYMLYKVVVGGDGVNLNSAASDEGAQWITWADIETYDASYELATIGALDTVVIYFDPEAVNSFTGANGMSAQILGKYVPGETPQPVEHTYPVAGSSEIAFGTAWDPANAANDMVKQEDGTYKWEKAEVELPAGTISFKIVEDHSWDVAYPASDYNLNIAEQGEYTITITFNPEGNVVNAVATKTGDAVVTVDYYLVGSVKGWEAKAENIFTLNAEAGEGIEEYVIETTLEVGEGLKVLSSTGTWYPEGMGNEYVVDQNHAGATTIYFRPAGNAEWAAFGGFMYVVPTGTVGFDNTAVDAKAVKVLRDGQVIIIRGEHEYTTMGQMIK